MPLSLSGNGTITGNVSFGNTVTLLDITANNVTSNTVYTNSKVGIGTTTPTGALQIYSDSGFYVDAPTRSFSTWRIGGSDVGYLGSGNYLFSGGSNTSFGISTTGTKNLVLGSADVERMRIDSNGRITKPYQPMFRAYGSSNYSWTTGVVNNNTAPLNVGNNYNTSTYRFVAPVAGYYFFYAHLRYYNGTSGNYVRHMQWNIRRNAGAYETVDSTFYNNIGQNQHVTTYITTIMDMNVNDYADQYIEYISSSGTITPYGQVFVGYLLG